MTKTINLQVVLFERGKDCYLKNILQKHTEMLRHSLGGGVIFSLMHFIAPALDLMPCKQSSLLSNIFVHSLFNHLYIFSISFAPINKKKIFFGFMVSSAYRFSALT